MCLGGGAMALDPAEVLEETESLVQTRYAVQRLREMATTCEAEGGGTRSWDELG